MLSNCLSLRCMIFQLQFSHPVRFAMLEQHYSTCMKRCHPNSTHFAANAICVPRGKYCKIINSMFVGRDGKNNWFFYDTAHFPAKNNQFLGQRSKFKISLPFPSISHTNKSFLTSYLVKILKLTCKLVLPFSTKFKLKRPVL